MSPAPEFELVRLAARASLGPDRARAFASLAKGALDWSRVLDLGAHHRVLPLLHFHLRDHAPESAPRETASALRDWVRRDAAEVLLLSAEMARIASRLEEEGVAYLVLKGPSLAEAYGGAFKRPFTDNDILVRRADFGRAERALLGLGFGERKRGEWQQSGYLRVYGEYTFGRAVGPLVSTVDVHTRIVPFGFAYSPDFEALRSRARTVRVNGHGVPTLSWADLFLTLSVNAVKDQWNRLRLATDLAEVASHVDDWGELRARARDQGALRVLLLSVLATADLVGGAFAEPLLAEAMGDRRASALARQAAAFLRTADGGRTLLGPGRVLFNLGVHDGLTGPLRYLGFTAVRRLLQRTVAPSLDERGGLGATDV